MRLILADWRGCLKKTPEVLTIAVGLRAKNQRNEGRWVLKSLSASGLHASEDYGANAFGGARLDEKYRSDSTAKDVLSHENQGLLTSFSPVLGIESVGLPLR